MATGSEVGCAVEAYEILAKQGIQTYVVSVPCMEILATGSSAASGATKLVAVLCGDRSRRSQSWFHLVFLKRMCYRWRTLVYRVRGQKC